jgi:hypothetical protein
MLKSLKIEPIFIILIAYILIVVTYGTYSYINAKTSYMKRVQEKLFCVAENIKRILPEDFHDKALAANSIPQKLLLQNTEILSNFVKKIGVLYVYTVIKKDGKYHITANSSTTEDLNSGNINPFFQEIHELNGELDNVFKTTKPIYLKCNGDSNVLTVIVPEYSPKGNFYVVGVDMNAKKINYKLNYFFWRSSILSGIFILLAIPFMIAHRHSKKEHIEAFQDLREMLHNKTTDRTAKMEKKIQEILKKR